ncbi:MAG: antibiotic biosynthesis monooxygenase [Xanthobacteraceae bacterium]|nr:antibiotic biosynthesis monooxygenase [Xanthobacteraceae bacterium]
MLRLVALAGLALAGLALAGLPMTVAGGPALAQDATFFTVTYVETGPVLAKVGAAALKTYRDASRKDNGVVHLDVLQRIDRPNQFVVLGAWANQMAYDAHAAGENAKKLNEKLATTLAAPNDTRQHNGLAVAPAKTGAKDPIYAITHVDVIPPQKDNGVAAVKQLAEDSRRHAANLSFDVWQQTNRPNHFTVVEAWANRGAFDLHQMQKDTREFRNKLATMTGALYDERLYKPLK